MAPSAVSVPPPPIVSLNQSPPAPAANSLAWNSHSAPQGMDTPPPSTFASAPPAMTPPPAAYAEQPSYPAGPTPRVRLPGYATPAAYAAPPQPLAQPAFNQVQTTELPAYPVGQSPGYAPAAAPSYQGDGFQPRGTSVHKPYSPAAP